MRQRRLLPAVAAALALASLVSCASEPESAWGSFAGAWEDSYQDSKEVFGKHFFNSDPDDPYARVGGWSAQGDDAGARAGRLFLDHGSSSGTRVPRHGQGRGESAAGDLWDWLLDND